jgi:hypothetical protein
VRLPFRSTRGLLAFAIVLWAAGVAGIWWLIPVGQPLPEGWFAGFLSDGRTLVTVSHQMRPDQEPASLVHLLELDSGNLRTIRLSGPAVQGAGLLNSESHDLLKIVHADTRVVSLYDARTGNEVASFPRPLADLYPKDFAVFIQLWVLSPDGHTTAFVNPDEKRPSVEWYDVGSGRLLCRLPGCRGPALFSPDSKRLAVVDGSSLAILDVATGRETLRLDPTQVKKFKSGFWGLPQHLPPNGEDWPQEFSPDGSLLLDGYQNVWEVATGRRRFGLPGIFFWNLTFTPDSKALVVWDSAGSDSWLAYYDAATGQEWPERRTPLLKRLDSIRPPWHHLKAQGQCLLAGDRIVIRKPTTFEKGLAKFTGYEGLGEDRTSPVSVLVEAQTGREILRSDHAVWACTPDGRYLVGMDDYGVPRLWENPPRKPLPLLLILAGAWSIGLALLVWWRVERKSFRAPQDEQHSTKGLNSVLPAPGTE